MSIFDTIRDVRSYPHKSKPVRAYTLPIVVLKARHLYIATTFIGDLGTLFVWKIMRLNLDSGLAMLMFMLGTWLTSKINNSGFHLPRRLGRHATIQHCYLCVVIVSS